MAVGLGEGAGSVTFGVGVGVIDFGGGVVCCSKVAQQAALAFTVGNL